MSYSGSSQDRQTRNILITGGCGFIGTNLVKYLADRGYQMRVLDNLSVGKQANLKKLQSQDVRLSDLDLIVGDVRDREAVRRAVDGIDAVVHLAAQTGVVDSVKSPGKDWDINVNGTINLLEASCQAGVSKFVFASSNAVLGEQLPPLDESKIPKPLSPYGASKMAAETICRGYYYSFGLKTVCLRFANCYGPYSEHKTSVIYLFMDRARNGKPLVIYGDGNQTRDFVHSDDICQAIHLALTATPPNPGLSHDDMYGSVFQIATGVETSVNDLVSFMREIVGDKLQVVYKAEREGEIRINYSDITKARRTLGFEPKVQLREGIRRLWTHTQLESGIH